MKYILFFLALMVAFSLPAQQTISGTFTPADEFTWIIAYGLRPGTQSYIADTAIKDGAFSIQIPESAEPGMYRMVYAIPQEEFYFDLIYTGKESIELSFSAEKGATYKTSEENIVFNTYFNEINSIQQKIISFYSDGSSDVKRFQELVAEQRAIQNSFEEKSRGLRAYEFISANQPYIPMAYESVQDYVANTKSAYFDHLNFNDPVLQASGFLTDKATNYVFTALPLEQMTQLETEIAMQSNVRTINEHLEDVSKNYKLHIFYTLWSQAAASGFNDLSDYIYTDYLQSLARLTNNQKIIDEIEVHNRLRLGATAPDIVWKDGGALESLSDLEEAVNYVLIFWSSTCGHCLKELPALHKRLMEKANIKVIAVGLEDGDVNWKMESAKLEYFEHVIALGKWESDYAKLYAIDQTPTYFILDSKKRIIAKPENDKAVVDFLERRD